MPAERAGYTVTMFVIDLSPSMGNIRTIELPEKNGKTRTTEMTNLQWSLQYVMYKIQEMIFHNRKTDQCGVITFGSTATDNVVNKEQGGYEHIQEFLPIKQPSTKTMSKLAALTASTVVGDPIEGLIVAMQTQAHHLASKPSWTRKMVVVTDGEHEFDSEAWEQTAEKLKEMNIQLSVVGVDFDDDEFPFHEQEKSAVKAENETFWKEFCDTSGGQLGTCAFALQDVARPEVKDTKSAALSYTLRIGDVDVDVDTSIEIAVKATKATALVRPPSMKKFFRYIPNEKDKNGVPVPPKPAYEGRDVYMQLTGRSKYVDAKQLADLEDQEAEAIAMEAEGQKPPVDLETIRAQKSALQGIEKEQLTRSYKYGATWIDVDDEFERLTTKQGIDICAFIPLSNVKHHLFMSEVQFLWGDPASGKAQVAFSSIVHALFQKALVAVARWVSRNGSDPKMGILMPHVWDNIDALSWVQMPFADDLRKYTFRSLKNLTTRAGDSINEHPFLPSELQQDAMDKFVDSMNLMNLGEKDEQGDRQPWFDPRMSFNPAVHRIKQALFHAAIVPDLIEHPVPPAHPDLTIYFDPPQKMLRKAKVQLEECRSAFHITEVVKKSLKRKAELHVEAVEGDELELGPSKKIRVTEEQPSVEMDHEMIVDSLEDSIEAGADDEPESISIPENHTSRHSENILDDIEPSGGEEEDSHQEIDRAIPNGRIIGTTFPLEDFTINMKTGDLVSKAVEDLAFIVQELVTQPFAQRRHGELLECLVRLREVCLHEDEVDAWNESIRELKDVCLSSKPPNNRAFWEEVKSSSLPLGLITKTEAARQGGKTGVADSTAMKFLS